MCISLVWNLEKPRLESQKPCLKYFPIVVLCVAFAVVILRSGPVRAIWQYVWSKLRSQAKIVLSTLQILAQFPSILYEYAPALLLKFLSMLEVTKLDFFDALGLACE